MIQEYKNKTNIGVGLGILGHIAGSILTRQSDNPLILILGLLFLIAGLVLFIWGCWNYAKGKGYHGAWGLLGLLSCIGLIILVFFPDKHK